MGDQAGANLVQRWSEVGGEPVVHEASPGVALYSDQRATRSTLVSFFQIARLL
jgi:hypothetical protein